MRIRKTFACLVGLAVLSGPAHAMMVDIPLEILVSRAELIVTGKVTMVAVPAQFECVLPDPDRPVKAWYTEYHLTVDRVIKKPAGSKLAKGSALTVMGMVAPPRGPGLIMVDGPSYTNLKKGTAYVVVLHKMPQGKKFYLPSYFKNFRPDRKQDVDPIVKAARVDQWAWGQPVNGLQLALVTTRSWAQLGRQVVRRRVGGRWVQMPPSVHVQCVMALRNVSKKPITVSLYQGDRFLSLQAVNAAGKKVNVDFYTYLQAKKIPAFDLAKNTRKVEPGKLAFVASYGEGKYGMGFNLAAPAGKWKLTAGYTSKRTVKDAALWTGTLASGSVDFEVKPARKR